MGEYKLGEYKMGLDMNRMDKKMDKLELSLNAKLDRQHEKYVPANITIFVAFLGFS